MAGAIVQADCQKHVDWDCFWLTYTPVVGWGLLATDRCQQQLAAYDACMYAKDAGYTPGGAGGDAGGGPVPPKDEPIEASTVLIIVGALLALVLLFVAIKR